MLLVKNKIKEAKNEYYNKIFSDNNNNYTPSEDNIFESRKYGAHLKI